MNTTLYAIKFLDGTYAKAQTNMFNPPIRLFYERAGAERSKNDEVNKFIRYGYSAEARRWRDAEVVENKSVQS
jgi:hypothetical protein